jgi:hypothetical protein
MYDYISNLSGEREMLRHGKDASSPILEESRVLQPLINEWSFVMLIKKVLVSLLATMFCLAVAGLAFADNEYEDAFASSAQSMTSTSMSSGMDTGNDMNAKSGDATTEDRQDVDHPNSRPVLCAASFHNNGELPQNHQNYCKNLYGS